MPERPKRRKHNKNKRKNKSGQAHSSKNESDGKNCVSCSSNNEHEEHFKECKVETVVDDNILVCPLSNDEGNSSACEKNESAEDVNNNNGCSQSSDTLLVLSEGFQDIGSIETTSYLVESPDHSLKNKTKLNNSVKSKSLDNEDEPKIVEVTEENVVDSTDSSALDLVDGNNVLITDVESDIEWEKTNDLNEEKSVPVEVATGSITTIPLNLAQCEHTESLTPDAEKSLRRYLKTLNLSTQPENINSLEIKTEIEEIINHEIKQRLRKKGLTEDIFVSRLGPPRILDVIDEEGSSESSMTSRRQSYLSEKKSDVEDLEDDVFEEKNKSIEQSKVSQYSSTIHHKRFGRLVPQECVLVGAKLKEPEVTEARGDWTVKTIEKITGAELVYLTDTSSSTSSLHDIVDEDDAIETDLSVRMITPTIEVTDTENFLKKTFISSMNDDLQNKIKEINESVPNNTQNESEIDTNECIKASNSNVVEHFVKIEHEKESQLVDGKTEKKEIILNTEQNRLFNHLESNKSINLEYLVRSECEPISEIELSGKTKVNKVLVTNKNETEDTGSKQSMNSTSKKIENVEHSKTKTVSKDNIKNFNAYITGKNEHLIKIELDGTLQNNEVLNNNNTENGSHKENAAHEKYNNEKKSNLNSHEIVVLSTDNIRTNLYVKDIDNSQTSQNAEIKPLIKLNEYDLEAKVIKCEFNDAINNLIKEVSSDSETINEYQKDTITRQDSSSSVSSQCTTKYNPNYSSLNDVSNIVHDELSENNTSNKEHLTSASCHVKDVFECVTGSRPATETKERIDDETRQSYTLKDLCVRKIASFPYGEKILEELASVSQRLQNITVLGTKANFTNTKTEKIANMPHFPLPDTSTIETVSLRTKVKDPIPPPVQPRNSSLKKSQDDDHWTAVPTKTEPVYVCLSPSQKMLIEKTNTVITKEDASHLVEMHQNFVDRRGYNESYKNKNQLDEREPENPPVIPFKSQTGSRLLALIRDPSLTRNITSLNQRLNNSLDEILKKRTVLDSASRFSNDRLNTVRDHSFKPIPPPRPKMLSSLIYESDENSDFTDCSMRSMKSERKYFHYSTGNLNKDIENDVSSIQNMHRFKSNTKNERNNQECPRRPSLPQDLCEQQMEYIRRKEKEVEAEIQRLEALKNTTSILQKKGPRAPLISQREVKDERIIDANNYHMLHKKDIMMNSQAGDTKKGNISSVFNSSREEIRRNRMYTEYVTQMAERQERKQHKLIKITTPTQTNHKIISKSMPTLDRLDSKVNNRIEKEFISKARERWDKLGIRDPETEDEGDLKSGNIYQEPKVIEHKIKVMEGGEEKDVKRLPRHLQDFVRFTEKDTDQGAGSSVVWRPGAPTPPPQGSAARSPGALPPPPPPPPVWTPGASPQTPRKPFGPVHFEETPPTHRKFGNLEQNGHTSGSESEGRLRTSHSAPVTGLNTLGGISATSRLPKAQNPTVTLLQKAREGQFPRGSSYLQQERDAARLPRDRPSPPKGDPVHALRKEYASEGEAERSDHERGGARKMADAHRKVEGIGPITRDGMPVALRSEVKDPSRWYKKMYDTIHKNKYDDDYVTIRYKSRRGQPLERPSSNKSHYAYFDPRSGYLSEPEGGLSRLGSSTWSDAYDSDVTTGPRRRTASVQEERRISESNSQYLHNNKYSTLASAKASHEVYKNQPGRIENYVPGKSSVVDKEAKQWWDEVMDIFDGQNISSTTSLPQASPKDKKDLTSTILSKSNMARALKESGYESDSTLVFRRRDDTEAPLSPAERRAAYRDLQAGGEPPIRGFRSPAPPRQETDSAPEPPRRTSHGSYSDTESPRRYVESDVNIHYRCPVRHDPLPLVPERELARQQAEHMKRLYREQKRNKYLQELQDMQNRRHQDNFTPSQKAVVPLNRYDEADKVIAKALYTFNGQTQRELSFRKGDLIHVRRQIDNNWYEGELQGRIGLFPYNYVEIQKGEVIQAPKKPAVIEGRARAKFDFTAQTNLELPLKKGEIVVLTRRIDQNWWEGRNASKTGIFPDSYVTVLQEPSQNKSESQPILNSEKPVASPAAHGLLNGSAKRSMGPHSYTPQPNSPALSNAPPATQPLPGYVAKPAQATLTPSDRGYGPPTGQGVDLNNTEPLYVDTNAEAIPYRAMYKYRPQNPDELELNEGDTVYVLEKCDDGWYVGSSQRTGRFGTFPGNYVERI